MATNAIADSINLLNEMLAPLMPPGVTGLEFLSVFLVIYAIIFLLMERIKFLKDNRGARLLLSLAIAYFTATSTFSTILITKMFPYLGMVTVGLLMFIIIGAFMSKNEEGFYNLSGNLRFLIVIVAIGVIVILTWTSMAGELNLSGFSMPRITGVDWGSVIIIGIFIFIIMLIFMSGRKEKKEGGSKKILEGLRRIGENF